MRRPRDGIQVRVMAVALLPTLILALLLGYYMVTQRARDLDDNLRQRGQLLARQLAVAAEYGVFSGNRQTLAALVDAVIRERDVAGVAVVGRGGVAAISGDPAPLPGPAAAPGAATVLARGERLVFAAAIGSPAILTDALTTEAGAASGKGRDPAGFAQVEMSTRAIRAESLRFAGTVSALLAGVMFAAAWVARRMSRRVSGPILAIAEAVERIGHGELAVRIAPCGIGVLDALAGGVNRMAGELDRSMSDLESKVEEATRQLLARKDEAERANLAKSRFLAAASHDLRQPMHALSMFVAALSAPRTAAEREHLVGQIARAVAAMGDLLDALLDISRLDAGGVSPQPTVFPLQSLFDDLRHDYLEPAATRRLDLVLRRSDCWVRSDRLLLARILRNLVSNALRYTPPGGRILVAARRRGDGVLIEVRDNGIGIAPESQESIFQEFVQLHNPERDRGRGLGLGLAIVRRLAGLLGHEIALRSRPGHGSVFGLTVASAPPDRLQASIPSISLPEDRSFEGLCVLVVDDDSLAREGLSVLLAGWKCRVRAEAGEAGLAARLVAEGLRPELVLCDFRLAEGLTGTRLIADIRAAFGKPDIAAAIMTGEADLQGVRAVSGGVPVLQKPVRPGQLMTLLRKLGRAANPSATDL